MATDFVPPSQPTGDSDGKMWAVLAHLSAFIGLPFILPLVIYLVKKNESAYVAENAREAINFHITMFLAGLLCFVLMFLLIGFFLLGALGIASFILSILAAIRASEGGVYRYPLCLRLI